jgi:hypothetical protein
MVRTSSIKLGLAIAWPAFWTGVPLKLVLVLLLLAAGLHPWEMPALGFLLVLSIPIDLWALSLVSRTVFLERLRREPPEGLGLTVWWQIALLSAVYFPVGYLVESGTIAGGTGLAERLRDFWSGLPVPERIGLELVMWGTPAAIVLMGLALGWLFAVGWIVRRQAIRAAPIDDPYPSVVRRWDLLRIPADPALTLTVFVASGVVLVLLLWAFMPVTTPHPHEDYKKAAVQAPHKSLKPMDALQKTETAIAQAESAVKALEAKAKTTGKEKGKDKSEAPAAAPGKAETTAPPPGIPRKAAVTAGAAGTAHDRTPHTH